MDNISIKVTEVTLRREGRGVVDEALILSMCLPDGAGRVEMEIPRRGQDFHREFAMMSVRAANKGSKT